MIFYIMYHKSIPKNELRINHLFIYLGTINNHPKNHSLFMAWANSKFYEFDLNEYEYLEREDFYPIIKQGSIILKKGRWQTMLDWVYNRLSTKKN